MRCKIIVNENEVYYFTLNKDTIFKKLIYSLARDKPLHFYFGGKLELRF